MATMIPQRELRNNNAEIIERVANGESFVVTRNGTPVAEIKAIGSTRRVFVPRDEVVAMFANSPRVDYALFRADLDSVVEDSVRDPYERSR